MQKKEQLAQLRVGARLQTPNVARQPPCDEQGLCQLRPQHWRRAQHPEREVGLWLCWL